MGFIVFSALMVLLFFDFDSYYEMLKTWEKPLNILMPWVIGLVTLVYFYYLSRKKVFYSDYYLKIFPLFGKAQEIPWGRLRQVEISQDMYQCVLTTEIKTYKFEANPWRDGWDDFIKTVAEMAEKYNIPCTQS